MAQAQNYTAELNGLLYTVTRKRVKNINLRVTPQGEIHVSAPRSVSVARIEAFVRSKEAWLRGHVQAAQNRREIQEAPFPYTKAQCMALFSPVMEEIFPLFADVLGGQRPQLRVRMMKTRWGVCAVQKHIITLNMRLALYPRSALEYVVLHEYVHFVHPDHQAGFHAMMAALMPDYRQRRKLLNAADMPAEAGGSIE